MTRTILTRQFNKVIAKHKHRFAGKQAFTQEDDPHPNGMRCPPVRTKVRIATSWVCSKLIRPMAEENAILQKRAIGRINPLRLLTQIAANHIRKVLDQNGRTGVASLSTSSWTRGEAVKCFFVLGALFGDESRSRMASFILADLAIRERNER